MPRCLRNLRIKSTATQRESFKLNEKASYLSDYLGKVAAVLGREPYQRPGERCQGGAMAHDEDDTWYTTVSKEKQ